MALEGLKQITTGVIPSDSTGVWLERTRNNYNSAMTRTTFGYQPVGWGLGPWKEQADTERPMPQEMKTYLDEMVLEGKIPDEFDKVELFQQILQELEEK